MEIDLSYNFRADSKGKDPDLYSRTLKLYHQYLWSKELPAGGCLHLDKGLNNLSSCGPFHFSSDSIIPTYRYWQSCQHIIQQVAPEAVENFDYKSRTIGGMIIFPRERIDNQQTINMSKGINRLIRDRFDLTLECIKRYYEGKDSPLFACLKRYASFFQLFGDFNGYTDFFFLQDLVDDKGNVQFFLPFDDFRSDALPQNVNDYLIFMKNSIAFINQRAERIGIWAMMKQTGNNAL